MNFSDIMPGAIVRFTVINGTQYLSVRDFIMVICNKDGNQSLEVWRRLSTDCKNEVQAFCLNFQFKGRGQQEQPVITFSGALILMNWLPGENAKAWRGKTADILKRYFAGDASLLKDIEANAASDAPINQAARAALAADAQLLDDPEQETGKRKRYEEGDEITMAARLAENNPLLEKRLDVYIKFCDTQERAYGMEIKYEQDKIKIELDKLDIEERKLSIERSKLALLNDSRHQDLEYKRALKAFESENASPVNPTPVPTAIPDTQQATTVLKVYEMNKPAFSILRTDQRKGFLQKAGILTAQLFREQFGRFPSKQDEGSYEVNSYPAEAHQIIMQALRAAYREITLGSSQTTLDAALSKRVEATA